MYDIIIKYIVQLFELWKNIISVFTVIMTCIVKKEVFMKKRVISAVLCLSMLAGSLCLEPTIQAAKKPRLN